MSTFSKEIRSIIEYNIVPAIIELGSIIANLISISFNSLKLRGSKKESEHLTLIFDFLNEYADGIEEIDIEDLNILLQIAGISESSVKPQEDLIIDGGSATAQQLDILDGGNATSVYEYLTDCRGASG